ncbi:hypothetical protein [Microbacterium sp.]|nr:hypothetical protein [Microbacterium sp.]
MTPNAAASAPSEPRSYPAEPAEQNWALDGSELVVPLPVEWKVVGAEQ